jgi:hypothetical protein
MSFENPSSILVDYNGSPLFASASQVIDVSGTQNGIFLAGSGSDGTARLFHVASDGALFVTGTVNASFTPTSNTPVSQGNPGAIPDSWYMRITDGSQIIGTGSSAPLWVSGAVSIPNPVVVTDGGGTLTVDGTVDIGNFPSVQSVDDNGGSLTVDDGGSSLTVDGTVTAQVTGTVGLDRGDSTANPLYVSGALTLQYNTNPSATVTLVTASVTVVTLAAANANRRGLMLFYNGNKNVYVKFGTAASITDFSFRMSANSYYEVPFEYTGILTGIWDNAAGAISVTEVLD